LADQRALEVLLNQVPVDRSRVVEKFLTRLAELSADVDVNRRSDLLVASFAGMFSQRLLAHHAMLLDGARLMKEHFEFALIEAAREAGWSADKALRNNPGEDIIIENTRFSLKTEAEVQMNLSRAKVSKWMEARWLRGKDSTGEVIWQEAIGSDDAPGKLTTNLGSYHRILLLRVFNIPGGARYEMWELDHSLFSEVLHLTVEDIQLAGRSEKTYNAQVRVRALDDGVEIPFQLKFDAAGKITIERIDLRYAFRHGSWTIRNAGSRAQPVIRSGTSPERSAAVRFPAPRRFENTDNFTTRFGTRRWTTVAHGARIRQ
jgi:type II restriction enzyme